MSVDETIEVSNTHRIKNSTVFYQNFVSILDGRSILLQPEACLFPSIFYKQLEDGSFPGALPLFFMMTETRIENPNLMDYTSIYA